MSKYHITAPDVAAMVNAAHDEDGLLDENTLESMVFSAINNIIDTIDEAHAAAGAQAESAARIKALQDAAKATCKACLTGIPMEFDPAVQFGWHEGYNARKRWCSHQCSAAAIHALIATEEAANAPA